jgi:hypothetical protein
MTRAFVALAHGDVPRALAASPLGAPGGWRLGSPSWRCCGRRSAGPARVGPRAARAAGLLGGAALLANWAYLVIAHAP